jgi:hypothetical protein
MKLKNEYIEELYKETVKDDVSLMKLLSLI